MKYIEEFLKYIKLNKNYSENTVISYKDDIVEFYNVVGDNIININELKVEKYLSYLHNKELNKNSISRKLSSIRSFYNYLYNRNIIDKNYFKDIHNPRKNRGLPHFLTESE